MKKSKGLAISLIVLLLGIIGAGELGYSNSNEKISLSPPYSNLFGFGQSQDDEGGYCLLDMRGILEYKICPATQGTGGGGQVDTSEQCEDKIRIRSKPNYAKYTCKSAEDHLTSKCVCEWSNSVKNNGGVAMNLGKCDDNGWQEYSFRKRMSMGDYLDSDWECGNAAKSVTDLPCDGCITKKYDKEFDLSDVLKPVGWEGEDGNPVLIQFRRIGGYDPCAQGAGSGPAGKSSWWCTSQAKVLFDYAVAQCDAMVSLDPALEFIKIATLTPEVQECLLKTLGCDSKNKAVKQAIMSKFTSELAAGGDPSMPTQESMFPRVDCKTGECEGEGKFSYTGCEDDVDKNFKCK